FFVGTAGGGDPADRIAPVLLLDAAELVSCMTDCLLPGDFLPGVCDAGPDHGLHDAVAVGGVAPGKAAFDAGVPVIGSPILVRNHADHFVALHRRLEGTSDAAIGTGCDDRMLWLASLNDRFLHQGGGRTGLDAGAAGDALGAQKIVRSGGDGGSESPPGD